MKYEDLLLLAIYDALEALGEVYPMEDMNSDDIHNFLRKIEPLTDAVKHENWGLITEAAKMHKEHPIAKKYATLYVRRIACDMFYRPKDFGIEGQPSKQDILNTLETKFPELFSLLPTSPRGLTTWWKKVGSGASQARGYPKRPNKT
jgi:hypothetical protein